MDLPIIICHICSCIEFDSWCIYRDISVYCQDRSFCDTKRILIFNFKSMNSYIASFVIALVVAWILSGGSSNDSKNNSWNLHFFLSRLGSTKLFNQGPYWNFWLLLIFTQREICELFSLLSKFPLRNSKNKQLSIFW